MSLCKRLIARLDVKGNKLIKGIRFEGLRVLGDPVETAYHYAREGIDEMLFIELLVCMAETVLQKFCATKREVFVPITAGGGIRASQMQQNCGFRADKIAINSEALKRPQLITELATEFGVNVLWPQYKPEESLHHNGKQWAKQVENEVGRIS